MKKSANQSSSDATSTFAVIGYGNPKRGDDAIGLKVVSQLKALSIPNVEPQAVTQLIPELSANLAAADCVIFVDACKLIDTDKLRIKLVEAYGSEPAGSVIPASGHACDPGSLLALTQSVYGHSPQAWWIEVPACNFAVGQPLSELAKRGVSEAIEAIQGLISDLAASPHD